MDNGDDTGASVSINENVSGGLVAIGSIDNPDDGVAVYSLGSVTGVDSSLFSIDSASGLLSVEGGLDFEAISGVISVEIIVNDTVDNVFF